MEENIMQIISHCKKSLCGKDTPFTHKAITGIFIMLIGVAIAKYVGHSESIVIAIIGDTGGYGLHGIGLIPFVERFIAEVV